MQIVKKAPNVNQMAHIAYISWLTGVYKHFMPISLNPYAI
jgi:hypothetical protein